MRTFTATAFARQFASIQDVVHREAVAVTSHGRTKGFFVSPEEYAELEQLRSKARKIVRVGELSNEMVHAIRESTMDPRHDALNDLMK